MVNHVSDADYLKSRDLGQVISKGMAAMYEECPKNPVDYLAKWLLNYSQVERTAAERVEELAVVSQNVQRHAQKKAELDAEEARRKKEREEIQAVKVQFIQKIAGA